MCYGNVFTIFGTVSTVKGKTLVQEALNHHIDALHTAVLDLSRGYSCVQLLRLFALLSLELFFDAPRARFFNPVQQLIIRLLVPRIEP